MGVHVFIQLGLYRYSREAGLLKSLVYGFFLGFGTVITIEGFYFITVCHQISEIIVNLFLNVTSFGALSYCYFHFINLGETARRIRIIRELLESPDGLYLSELYERYNSSDIIDIRIQRMLSNKQIVQRDGRYHVGKPILLIIAKFIVIMKIILLRTRSELH